MNNQVRDFARQCDTCQTFGPKQQKETMINDVVDQPWITARADLFHFDDRDHLITVDYFSNYWEADYPAGGYIVIKRDKRTPSSVSQVRLPKNATQICKRPSTDTCERGMPGASLWPMGKSCSGKENRTKRLIFWTSNDRRQRNKGEQKRQWMELAIR